MTLTSVETEAAEARVDGEDLADGEDEVLAIDLAEAAAADGDLVVAGLEEGGGVVAIGVGGDGAGDPGVGVVTTTVALGTTAPAESVTVPVMLPAPEVWPEAGRRHRRQ